EPGHARPQASARWRFGVGLEEALDAIEEALGLRVRFLTAFLGELFQELALFRGQIDRRFHLQLDVQIAPLARAELRHAFAFHTETPARLSAGGNGDLGAAAVDGGDFHLAAEGGFAHRRGRAAIEIRPVALEEGVRLYREKEIEIAGRTATRAAIAFT